MFHRTRTLSARAVGIATFCAANSAAGQLPSHYPEAGAAVRTGPDRSTVVQDAHGFSITDGTAKPSSPPVDARVPLGTRLTLDRALFARVASLKEASDAPRR